MKVIGVIPARYQSTRFTHKLLHNLKGKPLLQWSWQAANKASLLDELIIACDHPEVAKVAEKFGARVVMTSPEQPSGTDRIAEAVSGLDVGIVVNIQADEPLIHPSVIDGLVNEMLSDRSILMATAKTKIDTDHEINNPNAVKVICDKDGWAIYFSRYPIPYYRGQDEPKNYYKHLGIYAYTKDFLYTFKNLGPSSLEKAEKLEQLRVIEAGYKIKVIQTQFNSWGVDTQEDLEQIEKILADQDN
ncbi:MAG: 3-deoxy-manno-octulosonate cytidylyltransferase [Candidatus Omnitrophica bacterium]|nr:3-deoxy-manno-octulosonate cytidylyltransferase [Candidatus Omnitrophota bacterium]MBU2250819.1 3-deoxy-manno-octulosonate cytidylyltransferase [Candidatus Omnitrophota bacterium]MBU2266160.1 3-deoxy-manno-octulosonate cytidylyltransferase [Candidatus Omnitrophota bacterium]MBU2474159.1 3-deoxy-manno-octulosonate cytidylyltransferase [Candidatus Omnitrophota bacterium]